MRTVSPDCTVSTGSRSTGNQPQTTFSGVDGTWWSGAGSCARTAPAAGMLHAAASTTPDAASERTIGRLMFIAIEYSC